MICKGTCKIDFETKSMYGRTWPNFETWPKCRTCQIRINFDGVKCPCCKANLKRRTAEGNRNSRNFTKQNFPERQLKIKKSPSKGKLQ